MICTFRQSSTTGVPTSACRSAITCCSSVNFDLRIGLPPPAPAEPQVSPRIAPSLYESPDGSGIGGKTNHGHDPTFFGGMRASAFSVQAACTATSKSLHAIPSA